MSTVFVGVKITIENTLRWLDISNMDFQHYVTEACKLVEIWGLAKSLHQHAYNIVGIYLTNVFIIFAEYRP
jgi:hypothetical protein